jgi:hypothetical protein
MAKNVMELIKPYMDTKAKKVMLERKRFTTANTPKSANGNSPGADKNVTPTSTPLSSPGLPQASPLSAGADSSATLPEDREDRTYMSAFVERACDQPEYGGFEIDGTFEEFSEVLTMYGYAVMFAAVYPIAPLLCAVLFIVELRVDGVKLFNIVQRPFPKSGAGIGAWKSILAMLSWFGLFSNAALLTYTFGVFRDVELREGQTIPPAFAFFSFSTAIISFKVAIAIAVPDDHASCGVVVARHHHLVRQLLGFSSKEADLMHGKDGQLGVNLNIDPAESGQLRDPSEFGLLNRRAQRLMKKDPLEKAGEATATGFATGFVAFRVMAGV